MAGALCQVRLCNKADRLKEVAELAKDELQKRSNPDKMLAAVLAQSRALASGCEHSTVEPLHVFVALVGEARGPVSETLSRCQVSYEKLREALKQRFQTGKPISESGLPLSKGVEDWMLAQFGHLAARGVGVDVATMLVDLIEASDRQVQRFFGDLGIMPGTLRVELLKTREQG